jgi:cold shock CspA family protein
MTTTGTVTRFKACEFGFIKPDSGGADIFCHSKQVLGSDDPVRGERVQFKLKKDSHGRWVATQVVIIDY